MRINKNILLKQTTSYIPAAYAQLMLIDFLEPSRNITSKCNILSVAINGGDLTVHQKNGEGIGIMLTMEFRSRKFFTCVRYNMYKAIASHNLNFNTVDS